MSRSSLNDVALRAMEGRITRILPAQIRECINSLNEEQLWWRPNEKANSVGNLVLHVSGSMRHYLSRAVGGIDYKRDRPAEFSERGPVPKADLLRIFDETIAEVAAVLGSFDEDRFLAATDEPDYVPTYFDSIFNVAIHLSTHTGQIIYITKLLEEGSVDELWIRAHRGN